MHARFTMTLLVAAALAAPAAAAGWSGKGSFEPSTARDAADGWMWLDPATDPSQNRVYFNGFFSQMIGQPGVATSFTATSPNLGAAQTAILPVTPVPFAMLGVWTDCNHDGYIGNTDAVYLYRAELLSAADRALCPPTPTHYPTHNDGIWVYEFIPITWENETTSVSGDLNTMTDNLAHVWADAGLPTDTTTGVCPGSAGALTSTGRFVAYADCSAGYRFTHTANLLADATGADDLGAGQLSFSDVPDGHQSESASALNRPLATALLGQSDDDAYVTAWDCSGGQESTTHVDPRDPTNGDTLATLPVLGPQSTHHFEVPGVVFWEPVDDDNRVAGFHQHVNTHVDPSGPNAGGSLAGTANKTDAGGTCDPEQGAAEEQILAGYTLGDRVECPNAALCDAPIPADYAGRTRPDALLTSEQWPHKYMGVNNNDTLLDVNDKQGSVYGSDFRQYWNTFDTVQNTGPVNRDASPSGPHHWTFYGYVSTHAVAAFGLTLPKGTATAAYGAEACALSDDDHLLRFDCDPTKWWHRADGTEITPTQAGSGDCWDEASGCDARVRVNDPYNLRDVDCFDYGAGTGATGRVSPMAFLSGQGC